MLDEIVETFRPVPAGWVVDCTIGGGGHARALLRAHPHLTILGLDRDPIAIAAAGSLSDEFPGRVLVRRSRFDRLPTVMDELDLSHCSGVLLDLGVSSPQLDRAERGFSYRGDGPLDMRMDPDEALSADTVVNDYPVERLAEVLRTYGDERYASRIARSIVAARPVTSTTELAGIIREAIPAPARRRGGHPATRSFQAIRIEVNAELEVLGPTLDAAIERLVPGGRVAVLTYHSGEDRLVKQRLRHAETGGCTCPPGLPCVCGAVRLVRLVARGGRTPTSGEVAANPRAASARLRVAERLEVAA